MSMSLVTFNPDNLKLNCSQLDAIMPAEKSRVDFTQTHLNILKDIYLQNKFGRKRTIISPYIDKGKSVEEQSIKILSEFLNKELKKNQEKFINDYIKGIPDLILEDTIIDVKTSWSIFTLPDPLFDNLEGKKNDYYWQIQGYLALTNKKEGVVAYVLADTPNFLIDKEIERRLLAEGINKDDEETVSRITSEIILENKYDDIPIQERVRLFKIARNEDDIQKIYNRVDECRKYLKNALQSQYI